jgi:hypothetical protein
MTLPCHFVYPYEANVTIEWLCLVIQDDGRSRVAGTAHNRALSHDGGSMWLFLLRNEKLHEVRLGGATRGKLRIPDGKGGEWIVFIFKGPKVVAPTSVD